MNASKVINLIMKLDACKYVRVTSTGTIRKKFVKIVQLTDKAVIGANNIKHIKTKLS